MKIKSIFIASAFVLAFFIIIPFSLISINDYFGLRVYENFVFKIVGIFLILVGILVDIHCILLFVKIGKGTTVPTDPPKNLVIKGLYRFMRNPIYLAAFLILLGEFLLFGRLTLIFYFLLSILTLNPYVVFIEEPGLKKRFGKEYIEYINKVPRWIPSLPLDTAKTGL